MRTHEGFLYVATVLDLFSRRIVGWSMDKYIDRHLVISALMMAVIKKKPKSSVLVHSDQGSQYGSAEIAMQNMTHNTLQFYGVSGIEGALQLHNPTSQPANLYWMNYGLGAGGN